MHMQKIVIAIASDRIVKGRIVTEIGQVLLEGQVEDGHGFPALAKLVSDGAARVFIGDAAEEAVAEDAAEQGKKGK